MHWEAIPGQPPSGGARFANLSVSRRDKFENPGIEYLPLASPIAKKEGIVKVRIQSPPLKRGNKGDLVTL
jgi:hypothetical protein